MKLKKNIFFPWQLPQFTFEQTKIGEKNNKNAALNVNSYRGHNTDAWPQRYSRVSKNPVLCILAEAPQKDAGEVEQKYLSYSLCSSSHTSFSKYW